MIKAFIFDMDGLMFDTEVVYKVGWTEAAAKKGYDLSETQHSMLRGANGAIQSGYFRDWFGDGVPFDEIKQDCRDYVGNYLDTHPIPIKAGLFELFNALQKKGIKIAVATGTRRPVAEKWWDKAGVTEYVDIGVGGDEVARGKPDPEIFLLACKRLGLTPAECAVVEDSFNGIRAAKAAGCIPIMVPDLEQPTEEIAALCTYVFSSLDKVIEII